MGLLTKASDAIGAALAGWLAKSLSPISGRGGWQSIIREPFAGAWQRNLEATQENILAFSPLYACVTLIATDIGKLRTVLREEGSDGIWREVKVPAFSPLLRKPNRYQNPIQFRQWWIMSKLLAGNVYVLKQRDDRNVVTGLYVLDPTRVQPMVTDEGDVYYALSTDNLNNLPQSVVVPASEIIHDRMNCLFHPLVGVSPLYAAALPAAQGLGMQIDSRNFFASGARPSGILTAPGPISEATAVTLKETWSTGFTGANSGKVAVVGDGMKFEPMKFTAVDSQFIEQMKLSAEWVCTAFHVPAFKIGAGTIPAGQKVADLNQIYYADCLQGLIEDFEQTLADGLSLGEAREIYCDIDGLLRMDAESMFQTLGEGIKNTILKPNEARKRLNLPPVEGGDSVLSQQQNYSLAALAKRDAQADPFATSQPDAPDNPEPDASIDEDPEAEAAEQTAKFLAAIRTKTLTFA